jgi:hypothetical protein
MLAARRVFHAKAERLVRGFLVCSGHCSRYTVTMAKVQVLNAASAAAPVHPLPQGRGLPAHLAKDHAVNQYVTDPWKTSTPDKQTGLLEET